MNIKNCDVYYNSDLKDYGPTEDGESFAGEIFFIIVQTPNGDRLRHNQTFPGVRVIKHEDGTQFEDIRVDAAEKCQQLVDHITAVGAINIAHWTYGRPAYGSRAYLDYGQANDLACERAEG